MATALIAASLNAGVKLASAADLPPVYSKAPAPLAYNWSGCYIGIHAGGGLLNAGTFLGSDNLQGGGALAGGQAGCNIQAGQFVFGLEGEGAWSDITSSNNGTQGATLEFNSVRNRWDTDLAVRLGLAVDRALIYGKVGAALGNFEFISNGTNSNPPFIHGESTLGGMLLGAGFEYAFAPSWTAKLEYNLIDFASQDVKFDTTVGRETITESATKQIVKVGVNYKFGN